MSVSNDATPDLSRKFLVVGIGGSAGAITSFREFFRNVTPDSGMAYVVILHLSPEHESRLAEVLQSVAKIPVRQVRETVHIEPDHVYVIPPNASLSMNDGTLHVADTTSYEERRAPIDIFLRTLADTNDSRAVGVIMSGSGTDGSMGVRRVKEYNGLVLVQDPAEAAFGEMPRNCIATGLVDFVVPVAEMPQRILQYREQLRTLHIPDESEQREESDEQALIEIFALLRLRTGHDFTNYKRATVLRRIERRMAVRDLTSLSAYAASLRDRHDETRALLRELLISVTNFFRDRDVWEKVEKQLIPSLLAGKRPEDHLRVWVPGCATGEEAYTIAMLLAERMAPNVQIFATDLDETAIARARDGWYSETEIADVSPERLRRFFVREQNGFRVRREIREMVLFAHHNLIKDPPFSHLDFVSCRNLLIYLNRAAQQRAIEVMHFALEPGGYLLVGTAEAVDAAPSLFSVTDKEAHLYQSRAVDRTLTVAPLPHAVATIDRAALIAPPGIPLPAEVRPKERFTPIDLHHRLLEQYASPSLVVDDQYNVIHLSDSVGRFLQFPRGEVTPNVLNVVRQELRIDLRSALFQAGQKRTTVAARNLAVHTGERDERIDVIVRPALSTDEPGRGFFLVLFEEARARDEQPVPVTADIESGTRQLEEELLRVKAQMRATIEQYEIQAEEAKAANEELQAMNEELRSTAEELETSQEELQSVNEELQTVNQELKVKIDEITHASDDMRNLMSSTDIGTIFVDRSLRVKLFTPRVRDVFNLIPGDVGRPLLDLTNRLLTNDLARKMERVLERLQPLEQEVETRDGTWYSMRLLPYRTSEDRIDGVVLTFLDITERHKAEEAMRASETRLAREMRFLEATLASLRDYVYAFDREGRFAYANRAMLGLFGLAAEQMLGKTFADLDYPPDLAARLNAQLQHVFATGESVEDEVFFTSPTGASGFFQYVWSPMLGADGSVELVVGVSRDTTERRRMEARLRGTEARQAFLLRVSDALRSHDDPAKIHDAAMRLLREYLQADRAVYMTLQVDDGVESYVIVRDQHTDGVRSVTGRHRASDFSKAWNAEMHAGRTLAVTDIETDAKTSPAERATYRALGIRAFVAAPILKEGKLAAVVAMHQSTAREWTTDQIAAVEETADRAWAAGERALAEAAVRTSEARLAADLAGMRRLYALHAKLATETNLQAALQEILATAVEFGNTDRGCIQLPTDDGQHLEIVASHGYAPNSPFLGHLRFEEIELQKRAANDRRRTIIEDTDGDPRLDGTPAGDAAVADNVRATNSTPMASRTGETVGVLSVQYREPHVPTEHELRLLDLVAWAGGNFLERHRARAALRASEERMKKALSIDTVGVLFFRLDGSIVGANAAFERMSGYSAGELRERRHWIDLTAAEAGDVPRRTFDDLSTRGETAPYEKEMLREDGSRWWGLFAPTRLSGEGRDAECVEFVIDITAMKRAEEATAMELEATRMLRDLATRPASDVAGDGMSEAILDVAIRVTHADAGSLQMLDRESRELVLLAHRGFPEQFVTSFMRVNAASHTSCGHALRTRERTIIDYDDPDAEDPDGSLRMHVELGLRSAQSTPLVSRSGETIGMLTTHWREHRRPTETELRHFDLLARQASDLLERTHAEIAVRESEARLQMVANVVPDLLWMSEADGATAWYNDRWMEYTGQSREQAVGWGWLDAIHPSDRARFADNYRQAVAEGRPLQQEHRIRDAAGEYRWFLVNAVPLQDASGRVLRFYAAATDVHEQRVAREELEQRVRERTRELAELSVQRQQLLDRLVAATEEERQRIARELHDEMGQHITALRIGLDALPGDERIRQLKTIIGRIDKSIDRLTLELRPPALDQLGLHGAISSLADEFSSASGLAVSLHVGVGANDRFSDRIESALYRVLQESLTNVWKHAGATKVSIVLSREPNALRMIVEDDGRGFDATGGVDIAARRGRFGLLGMRERLALVGGTLDIESAESGTTVYARVPLE